MNAGTFPRFEVDLLAKHLHKEYIATSNGLKPML
jgi:hypothetical protein